MSTLNTLPITSNTAKTIANSLFISAINNGYEGKSSDGKTIVVYAKTTEGWTGRNKDCPYCGKFVKANTCHPKSHFNASH